MSERARPWSAWVGGGSIGMAAIAAIALATTVLLADRALSDASDVIVRGEADSLMAVVANDLATQDGLPSTSDLGDELNEQTAQGLRYVALVDREGKVIAEAGVPTMGDVPVHPGQPTMEGNRVRTVGGLFPQHRGHFNHTPGPPPILAIEFEPPVLRTLRGDLARISVVALLAGGVLIAFAIAWSRSASRLATIQEQAARDERLVALGGMSSVMAHELRNPLASLKGNAQLLVEDLEPGKNKTKAERVVSEAERLEVLTTSLLDFVRDGPIDLRDVSTNDLIDQALAHVKRDRVAVDLEGAPKMLHVDEGRLTRAIGNLVQNALQMTEDDAKVDVTITEKNGEIVIDVRDRGPGIAAGSEAHIFEPFVTTRVRGTGLGLPVARRIAEQHRGTLVGENHPDGGAVFRIRFPIAS
ncbi:MAG: ATP-binding protein [Polyangiaceae bacterium]